MKKADLEKLEATVMAEVVKRRQLGGYSVEAEGLLIFGEALMRLMQHTLENTPDDKPAKKKNETD